jgi:Xaa-Pro aminopeptidase
MIKMENIIIMDRLAKLRAVMAEKSIDYYMIPTADFHNSEYVSDYFKVREYFSNFTGSNGTLLVWKDGAGLWTDGRYFIQAEKELEGTEIVLYRMQDEGVPTIEEFLKESISSHTGDTFTIGFDGRVLSAKDGLKYEKVLNIKEQADSNISFKYDEDLASYIWNDRPDFPAGEVYGIPDNISGMSVADKLSKVREKLKEEGADSFLLTKLDDIMWLYNIRGCDVECNPVAMSYTYIDMDSAVLFIQKKAFDGNDCADSLKKSAVEIREYDEIINFLQNNIASGSKILADVCHCSYMLYKTLKEKTDITVVEKKNPTELMKAIKNPVELENLKKIYLKDSVAVTKFIYWLKNNIGKTEITEVSAAEKLEEFRREIPEFMDLSFPTIAGYRENAAMMHYEATEDNYAVLHSEGMLLVDSGGQYMGGTTDVTRTIVLGHVTDDEKYHYTLTAIGMLNLAGARWLYGCSGRNLDILARQKLWEIGIDYKCGTGHGVGYMLNVHEGPQNMRWRFAQGADEAALEEGMIITNEPGVYIEGKYGIRIENVMAVKKDFQNEYGQFMSFEMLTWVPLDMEAIEEKDMPVESYMRLMHYQKQVYEKISPYLDEDEREWLKKETREESVVYLKMGENTGTF